MSQSGIHLPPEQKLMVRYSGAELFDCGSIIRIQLTQPNIKVSSRLRKEGWRLGPNNSLQAVSTPAAIFAAQAILSEQLGKALP